MKNTIFTDRETFAATLRAEFIVDGMSEVDAVMINDAIAVMEADMVENGMEGAKIRSDFLDVTVTLTAYADQAREVVAAGAALLDSLRDDDWRTLIDRDRLNIASTEDCVIAQLYDSYDAGCSAVRRVAHERDVTLDLNWIKAFSGCSNEIPSLCCADGSVSNSLLTLAWRELLESSSVSA